LRNWLEGGKAMIESLLDRTDEERTGQKMYELMARLFPITRSITGDGVRQTLSIIQERIPLQVHQVPTGTRVFDWTVPREWKINDAYIKDSTGRRIVDYKRSNLHVLNYSVPVNRRMKLDELREHLHTLPDNPNWIPYRTTYYEDNWGFCIPHRLLEQMENNPDETYEVVIDSRLENGHVTWGEYYLPGASEKEIVLTCHICHPSMCNDSLSGVVLLTQLAQKLEIIDRKYSYRLLFLPETIGAITWLSQNRHNVDRIACGIIATCLGDAGPSTYKRTRNGNHMLDQLVEKMLDDYGGPYRIKDFSPMGSDERQFSSPGFNLPFGSLMRTSYYDFPQYHTSADDLKFVRPEFLANSYSKYCRVIYMLETNEIYWNQNPYGEPQLGSRGLYQAIGGQNRQEAAETAMFWVLNFSDGKHSLLDIAMRADLPYEYIAQAAYRLAQHGLLSTEHKGGLYEHQSYAISID
jgi:aminopeptidase-like protein